MTTKVCNTCKISKPITEFYKSKDELYGVRGKCKECTKLYDKQHYETNRLIRLERQKQYKIHNRDAKLQYYRARYITKRDEILAKSKEYHLKNKTKRHQQQKDYRANNKAKINERGRLYSKTEKGKLIAKNKNHKRRQLQRIGDVSTLQLHNLLHTTHNCYWCKSKLTVKHIDHYIPLSLGGEHTLSNLVVSCPSCNYQKSNSDPKQFAQKLGRLL